MASTLGQGTTFTLYLPIAAPAGATKPEVVAPGDRVTSRSRFNATLSNFRGTSFSTPMVSGIVALMRSLLRQLEIARDMAMHAPLVPDWTIEIHERTLAAVRSADFPLIDAVMDEHLAELEQIWERETGRGLVRPLPDFLQPVAERSRALRTG
mgnify:CR=1 FL=1